MLELSDLPKNDHCYLEAIEAALQQRGNYRINQTEWLTDLKYLFQYRISQSKKIKTQED